MARAIVNSTPERRGAFEPLYNLDPCTGAIIEVFYCDQVLAKSFDTEVGWLLSNVPQSRREGSTWHER